MKFTQIISLVFAIAFAAAIGTGAAVLVLGDRSGSNILGASNETTQAFSSMATSGAATVGTGASVRLLATSTSAQYRILQNNSPFSVYLRFEGDKAATANSRFLLAASSTYEMTVERGNLYRGSITGISTGGTATVVINEY